MKVIALGNLSGATGDREKGEVFEVPDKQGAVLVERKLVQEVVSTSEKLVKAKD